MGPKDRIRLLASLLVPLMGFLAGSGCMSPTVEMQKQAAFNYDAAVILVKEGTKPGSRLARELVASTKLIEKIVGSPPPEQRLKISDEPEQREKDLDVVAASRKQAAEDAESGGFWAIVSQDTLYALGTVASLLGLGGVGTWLIKRSEQIPKIIRDADDLDRDITKHETTILDVTKKVSDFAGET